MQERYENRLGKIAKEEMSNFLQDNHYHNVPPYSDKAANEEFLKSAVHFDMKFDKVPGNANRPGTNDGC